MLDAWSEFLRGKKNKSDVQQFSFKLMDNILSLHSDLLQRKYKHLPYTAFSIHDPKPRKIHKAFVRDRLMHHAIYRVLYPYFDPKFINESFSCRLTKGTHKAINKFKKMFYKVSKNNTKACWVLKCDIKKFFDSVDHEILFNILQKEIADQNTLWLLREIITSFNSKVVQLELFDLPKANRERERERETIALRARDSYRQFNKPTFC